VHRCEEHSHLLSLSSLYLSIRIIAADLSPDRVIRPANSLKAFTSNYCHLYILSAILFPRTSLASSSFILFRFRPISNDARWGSIHFSFSFFPYFLILLYNILLLLLSFFAFRCASQNEKCDRWSMHNVKSERNSAERTLKVIRWHRSHFGFNIWPGLLGWAGLGCAACHLYMYV
jgi:hypothetical protein